MKAICLSVVSMTMNSVYIFISFIALLYLFATHDYNVYLVEIKFPSPYKIIFISRILFTTVLRSEIREHARLKNGY